MERRVPNPVMIMIVTDFELIKTCFRLWECGVVLAGVKAKPYGWQCRVVSPWVGASSDR